MGARDLAEKKGRAGRLGRRRSDRGTVTGQNLTKGRSGGHLLTLRGRAITWQWRIDHVRRPGGEKEGSCVKEG